MSETRITRRMVVAGLVALPLMRVPDTALPEDDAPRWDCEIDDTWVWPGAPPEMVVSAVRRGSMVAGSDDPDGWGHWRFAWLARERLATLGAEALCRDLLWSVWAEDGDLGTVTVRLRGVDGQEVVSWA